MEIESENSCSLNDRAELDEQIGSESRSESFEIPSVSHHSSKTLNTESLYSGFVLAKADKVLPIYNKFKDLPVIIEGPERSIDLTYFLVSMQ